MSIVVLTRRRRQLLSLVFISGCLYYSIRLWWSLSSLTFERPAEFLTTTAPPESRVGGGERQHGNGRSRTTTAILVEEAKAASPRQQQKHLLHNRQSSKPPCRILLENKVDFHYEVIESTALRYPLPWDELGCDPSSPQLQQQLQRQQIAGNRQAHPIVVVDVALAPSYAVSTMHSGKVGWERYFSSHLQGRIQIRPVDQVTIQFGNLVEWEGKSPLSMSPYHAVIGVTCDAGYKSFKNWIKQHSGSSRSKTESTTTPTTTLSTATEILPRAFCVMHLACHNNETLGTEDWHRVSTKYKCGPRLLERLCGLSPMYGTTTKKKTKLKTKIHSNSTATNDNDSPVFSSVVPSANCYFIPSDLPRFDKDDNVTTTTTTTSRKQNKDSNPVVELCVVGDNKDHALLAQAFQQHGNSFAKPLHVSIFGRYSSIPEAYTRDWSIPLAVVNASVASSTFLTGGSSSSSSNRQGGAMGIHWIQQDDYLDFHYQIFRTCHILLPLIDPYNNPAYFDPVYKKATGTMPLAIAYQIPIVLHEALYEIYKDHLTTMPSVELYHSNTNHSIYQHHRNSRSDSDSIATLSSFAQALQRSIHGVVQRQGKNGYR
jgi:hypothetical protein